MTSPARFPLEIHAWRRSPHTMTSQHASVVHYSSDVASWMRMLVPAWCCVKPSGPAQRRAVWVAQKHAYASLLSRRQEAGPDYGNEIDPRHCVSSSLSCCMETRGGAPSSAAANIRPSKLSKLVPVNSRNGMRRTGNNLAIALTSWALRCRYRAESPASCNCQQDKITRLKNSLACNSTRTLCRSEIRNSVTRCTKGKLMN